MYGGQRPPPVTIEPVIFYKSKSFATVFAALFFFVLVVAIIFLVGLAVLTDGFKHLTVEQRCRERWSTLSGTKSLENALPASTQHNSGLEESQFGVPSPLAPVVPQINTRQPAPPTTHASEATQNICLTPDCVRIASSILTSMNFKIDPCKNFYEFSCGGYNGLKQVPESEKKISVFTEARSRLRFELRELLDDSVRDRASDVAKLVYVYYDSCMDDQAQDALDLMPIFSVFSSLGGWALLQNAKFENRDFHWEGLESHLQTLAIDGLLKVTVKAGTSNSTGQIVFGPPKLLLGDRNLYVIALGKNEHLQYYRTYMLELLELFGADSEALEPQINEILNFEQKLANISTISSKPTHFSFRSLRDQFKLGWKHFLNGPFTELLPNGPTDSLSALADADYLFRLEKLVQETSPQVINDYLMWKVLSSLDPYLPQRYRVPHEALNSVLRGATVKPLWEECVNEVSERLPVPLTVLYSRAYGQKRGERVDVEAILADLRAALHQTILNADWMDEGTRAAAVSKLQKLRVTSDVSKSLPNEAAILQPYSGIRLVGNAYLDNHLALRRAAVRQEFRRLRPIRTNNPPLTLLADLVPRHRFLANELIMPSGFLQLPFFVENAPDSVNYGSLGALVAREMAHAFDDYGSHFDADGRRQMWWQADTERFFDSKKKCFIAQYDSKSDPISGRKISGKRTLRENIADNGALRTAYAAYSLRATRETETLKLPALANFTDHQLYFIAYANTFCEAIKVNTAQQLLDSEPTAPGVFRVNVPLQNFPAFAQAFNCPIGSEMNPYEKCRIW